MLAKARQTSAAAITLTAMPRDQQWSGFEVLIVRSRNGVPVRLTEERWQHIVRRHPEMDAQRERVLETLVGAYREASAEDGFILTAYLTSRPSARRITIWKR